MIIIYDISKSTVTIAEALICVFDKTLAMCFEKLLLTLVMESVTAEFTPEHGAHDLFVAYSAADIELTFFAEGFFFLIDLDPIVAF